MSHQSKTNEPEQPQWKVVTDGDKAIAKDVASDGVEVSLRRTDDGWMIDSMFSDEMIREISNSFSSLTSGPPQTAPSGKAEDE